MLGDGYARCGFGAFMAQDFKVLLIDSQKHVIASVAWDFDANESASCEILRSLRSLRMTETHKYFFSRGG